MKVNPVDSSNTNLEKLRKAEVAWSGNDVDNYSSNKVKNTKKSSAVKKKLCRERINDHLPHGHWLVIIYRMGIFITLILYINLKMGNDYVFEVSEKYRSIVPDKYFENVKTHADLFDWLNKTSKAVFFDSTKTYNGHPHLDQDMFAMMVFGFRVTQVRDDYLMGCLDPMVKKQNPIALALIHTLGYNCSKSYNGQPWHPKVFVQQDVADTLLKSAKEGEKCRSCPYFKKNNISCENSGDPFVPQTQNFEMLIRPY